jgi:aminoglycoside phosphotransferase (APT) family kinase protein
VRDNHAWVEHFDSETIMTTAAQFRTFQFSIAAPCGAEYTAFLLSLLPRPDPRAQAVFTHGDVSPLNIMVDKDPKAPDQYAVTGIIDWEEGGFYPAWFESSKTLYTFSEDGRGELQGWRRYLFYCIAPKRYAAGWAIGRL